jgi:hypothetical protein
MKLFRLQALWMIVVLLAPTPGTASSQRPAPRCTVMCYMNGDNNLTDEVLHAVDMMETVGSSKHLTILALVDGRRNSHHKYGKDWETARLLYITQDDQIGVINSPVLMEFGELDLGDPQTLEDFITTCLRFPADRYVFYTFAHGHGIIETPVLELPAGHKSIAISKDDSSGRLMSLQEFNESLRNTMGSRKFDLMVFFSCLANMVEVGYSLRDLTDYIVGSEDVIRIVDDPPGTFQIRGILFEELLRELQLDPHMAASEMGKQLVESFIEQYQRDVTIPDADGHPKTVRYAGSLSLVRCGSYRELALKLDYLARVLSRKMMSAEENQVRALIAALHGAMLTSQRYQSFMNLEYYDLQDFLMRLNERATDQEIKKICGDLVDFVRLHVVIHERHTTDSRSNGVSIFLSNYLVPKNIYQTHQVMYSESYFGRETDWDEMIDLFRRKMDACYPNILNVPLNAEVVIRENVSRNKSSSFKEPGRLRGPSPPVR